MPTAAHLTCRLSVLVRAWPILAVAAGCGGGPRPGAATPLAAGGNEAAPPPLRPQLPPGADTCEAYAYYRFGLAQLQRDPKEAAAAFYWTRRLQPTAAVAYYSERVARLMSDPDLLRRYMNGDRRDLQSAEVRQIDSLQVRALALDPFLPQALDENLVMTYFTNLVHDELRGQAELVGDAQIAFYLRRALQDAGPATRGWLAYARGDYREAARDWADELRHDRKNLDLRVRRAQALYLMGERDSARAELEAALAAARRSDAEKMKYVYDSKTMWEYELGRTHEMLGKDSAARDAYQRALVEDLSFYPAHDRLAYLALHARDTATAVTELQRAIEIQEDDFSARLVLGRVHAARRAFGLATEQLRRATAIEPWAAEPHFLLGQVLEGAGDRNGAVAEYQRFLALAARGNQDVDTARQRLVALSAPAP